MQNQYSRTQLLLGAEAMEKLHNSRVAVFGIGGVGGYTVEALARSGVGALDLIDDQARRPPRPAGSSPVRSRTPYSPPLR